MLFHNFDLCISKVGNHLVSHAHLVCLMLELCLCVALALFFFEVDLRCSGDLESVSLTGQLRKRDFSQVQWPGSAPPRRTGGSCGPPPQAYQPGGKGLKRQGMWGQRKGGGHPRVQNGLYTSSKDGQEICCKFNRYTCDDNCPRAHRCQYCLGPHSITQCPTAPAATKQKGKGKKGNKYKNKS